MAFFSAIKRAGAVIAGIPLTLLGGFLVYESFTGGDDNWLFDKISWFVLIFGLGLFFYGFSDPNKKPGPAAEASGADKKQ